MGVGGALVDRAREVKLGDTALRVAGSTVLVPVEGNWFRCRLELPAGPEQPGPNDSRRRQVTQPTMLYEEFDELGEPVDLNGETRVQIDSEQYGTLTFEVVGDPQPIRRKRSLIAHQATLRRVADHQLPRLGVA